MPGTFDTELLGFIRKNLPKGGFVIGSGDSAYFAPMTEILPADGSRVAWAKLPGCVSRMTQGHGWQDQAAAFLDFHGEPSGSFDLMRKRSTSEMARSALR